MATDILGEVRWLPSLRRRHVVAIVGLIPCLPVPWLRDLQPTSRLLVNGLPKCDASPKSNRDGQEGELEGIPDGDEDGFSPSLAAVA